MHQAATTAPQPWHGAGHTTTTTTTKTTISTTPSPPSAHHHPGRGWWARAGYSRTQERAQPRYTRWSGLYIRMRIGGGQARATRARGGARRSEGDTATHTVTRGAPSAAAATTDERALRAVPAAPAAGLLALGVPSRAWLRQSRVVSASRRLDVNHMHPTRSIQPHARAATAISAARDKAGQAGWSRERRARQGRAGLVEPGATRMGGLLAPFAEMQGGSLAARQGRGTVTRGGGAHI